MTPVRIFHRYRGLRNLTFTSLLAAAREVIPTLIAPQSRYKVGELPTERTIRYYMSRGLVDKPAGKQGTRSLYTYRHLLQILAVKHLQSQYLPLRRIEVVLRNASNRELEGLLPGGRGGSARVGPGEKPRGPVSPGVDAGTRTAAKPAVREKKPDGSRWLRLDIADGVELHIRDGAGERPFSPGALETCRESVRRLLSDQSKSE